MLHCPVLFLVPSHGAAGETVLAPDASPSSISVSLCNFDQFRHLSVSIHILVYRLLPGMEARYLKLTSRVCVFSVWNFICVCVKKNTKTFREGGWGGEIVNEKGRKKKGLERERERRVGGCFVSGKIADRNSIQPPWAEATQKPGPNCIHFH